MSDWTEYEYQKVFSTLNEDEMYGPLDILAAKPSVLNKKKMPVESHHHTYIDWRE
jgi:hypothetical protein